MSKSGAASASLPKCKYFLNLQFLQEKVTGKETESNVTHGFTSEIQSSCQIQTPPSSIKSSDDSFSSQPPKKRSVRREATGMSERTDHEILSTIKDMNKQTNSLMTNMANNVEENENTHFCKSLVPIFDRLSPKENILAKIEVQKVLFNIEFNQV